jgi:hypothetical protein
LFLSQSDPATKGLDDALAWAVNALFGITGVVMATLDRAPRTGVLITLAFPIAFLLLFAALVISFAV